MGRPKKRRRGSEERIAATTLQAAPQIGLELTHSTSIPESYQAPGLDTTMMQSWMSEQGWDLPAQDFYSGAAEETAIPAVPELTPDPSNSSSSNNLTLATTPLPDLSLTLANQCACLSSMYLSLSNLQSMTTFSFPSSLHTLRSAINTAWEVLHCPICPSRFLTAMHNVHLLGILLISIVERYTKMLESIDSETQYAISQNETRTFSLVDLKTPNSHLHTTDNLGCYTNSFSVHLAPEEWSRLAKKVVKAEVVGTPDGCCPGFVALVTQMERRQKGWHASPLHIDYPQIYKDECSRPRPMDDGEYQCLTLVEQSKKIVSSLQWD